VQPSVIRLRIQVSEKIKTIIIIIGRNKGTRIIEIITIKKKKKTTKHSTIKEHTCKSFGSEQFFSFP
jgi:hypothetical protein